jgi:hypothetical protein
MLQMIFFRVFHIIFLLNNLDVITLKRICFLIETGFWLSVRIYLSRRHS